MQKDYTILENSMVKYRDLVGITVQENGEPFVLLPTNSNQVIGQYLSLKDMQAVFPQVPIRLTVKKKLDQANTHLQKKYPYLQLIVSYGYRSSEIQNKYFFDQKKKLEICGVPAEKIYEEVHRFVAVPSVAGHPTGGAVDVLIWDSDKRKFLDFGTTIFDFSSKDMYALSPYISEETKTNRLLLRNILIEVGFAPFDGEWWHFSYGDKEWAYYYKQPNAIYEQMNLSEVKLLLGI